MSSPLSIEFNVINGDYIPIYVPLKNINNMNPFYIGDMQITITKPLTNWILTFLDQNNLPVQLSSFTNSYLQYTNMDVYFFTSTHSYVFVYMLFGGGNSYFFNYYGKLLGIVNFSGHINRLRFSQLENFAFFIRTVRHRLEDVALSLTYTSISLDFNYIALYQNLAPLQPLVRGFFTLVNGVAIITQPLVSNTTIIFLSQVTVIGTPGFLYVSNVNVGNNFTVLSGSSLDNSICGYLLI